MLSVSRTVPHTMFSPLRTVPHTMLVSNKAVGPNTTVASVPHVAESHDVPQRVPHTMLSPSRLEAPQTTLLCQALPIGFSTPLLRR